MADEYSNGEVSEAVRTLRGERTQDWLGAEVARVERRNEPYGQNTVAGWESARYAIKPDKVFAIEAALGVPAGSISQLAGFVPNHVKPSKSVVDAVKIDNDLSRDQKEDLTALYKGMVARSRARRRQQQS